MHAVNGDLYHREREISLLQEVIAGLALGRPAVVTVHGPRGMGKSALLNVVPRLLPEGALVLRARCHPSESGFPYSMVRQLFDPVLGAAGRAETFIPAEGHGSSGEAAGPTHEALLHLLSTTRSLAADRPVAVLVDDLQYADEPSLRWFSYLARRLDDLPVLLVATLPDSAAARLTDELGPLPYLYRLWPEPLCSTCTTELVDRAFDSPVDQGLAALCDALAHGNPMVLHDLVNRLRREHVPPGAPDPQQVLPIGAQALSETVLAWLDEDDPAAGELLTQLAVLGPDTDPAMCGALSQHGEVQVLQARDALVRAGLLEAGPPARFPHAAVRPAVLARVPAEDRLHLHGRAATVLARLGAPARQTAEHLVKAGCEWGLDVLRDAGAQAAAAGDHASAARYLRRALALLDGPPPGDASAPERPGETPHAETFHELTVRLASVELHRDLDACARQTVAAADSAPGPVGRAEVLARLASPALVASLEGAQPFVRACGELAALAAPPREPLLRLTAQALLTGHRAGVRAAARLAARGPLDPAARSFSGALAAAAAATGRTGTAQRLAARVEVAQGAAQEAVTAGWPAGPIGAALALIWTGAPAAARDLATRVLTTARAADDGATVLLARLVRAEAHHREGRFSTAYADAEAGLALARRLNAAALTSAALSCAARALVGLDRADDAAEVLREDRSAGDLHPFVRALSLQARGEVAAARGDHTAALGLFLDCGHRLALRGITNPACLPWRTQAARAYRALGEEAAAATILNGGPRTPAVTPHPASAPHDPERPTLTPAEQRVVELVLRGHSSLEVSERLFLSKRTVDTHLGRVYRKLGIHSRHELAAALSVP
ncbi:LuxR family transcriptional regulator [Streptomyces sp. FZ201]|uniref:AAA family ATPase n=1 Tax=Streptomyces sp. FZ201 TaxID=3057122 RepID=UPI0021C1BE94|nr:LuxR family transcriptional regulator [Streptomyces sp. FZ201]